MHPTPAFEIESNYAPISRYSTTFADGGMSKPSAWARWYDARRSPRTAPTQHESTQIPRHDQRPDTGFAHPRVRARCADRADLRRGGGGGGGLRRVPAA